MASLTLLKLLGVVGAVGGAVSIPTGIFLSRSGTANNSQQISNPSVEDLRARNCYTIASNFENKKHLLVCQRSNSLNFYLVDDSSSSVKKIEKIISAVHAGIIMKAEGLEQNQELTVMPQNPYLSVVTTLNGLNSMPLSSHPCKLEDKSNAKNLNCGRNISIPLTKYQ